jgi:hypothetical protein
MKYLPTLFVLAIFGLTSSAAIIPRQLAPCCFSLNAQGGDDPKANGPVQLDSLGLNHVSSNNPRGSYCVNGGATITTSQNRTCFVNPISNVLECEAAGFTPESSLLQLNGSTLAFKGSQDWWACPSVGAASDGSYIIYSAQIDQSHTAACKHITLLAAGFSCTALGRPAPPSQPSSSATPNSLLATNSTPTVLAQLSAPTPIGQPVPGDSIQASQVSSAPSALCPTDISGKFLPPNLIIPVNSDAPNTAYGTQYTASISSTNSSTFTFDIPSSPSYNGTCALIFLFPFGNQAQFPYDFSGIEREQLSDGGLKFALLSNHVSENLTFATLPNTQTDYGKTEVLPGNGYNIATYQCQSGQKVSYVVGAVGDVELSFFEATGKSPLGVFVVPCA